MIQKNIGLSACIRLQRKFKNFFWSKKISAAKVIRKNWVSYILKIKSRNRMKRIQRSLIEIQRLTRGFIARHKLKRLRYIRLEYLKKLVSEAFMDYNPPILTS